MKTPRINLFVGILGFLLISAVAQGQEDWQSVELPGVPNGVLGVFTEPGEMMLVATRRGLALYDLATEEWSYPTFDFDIRPNDYMTIYDLEITHAGSDTLMAAMVFNRGTADGTGIDLTYPCLIRSENGGQHWFRSDDGLGFYFNSNTVAIDPFFPDTILYCSDDFIFPPYFFSQDGGDTWSRINIVIDDTLSELCVLRDIAFSRHLEGIVVAGTMAHGILRSVDHGMSWETVAHVPVNLSIWQVKEDPNDPAYWYAAGNGGLIFISADTGKTWTEHQVDPNGHRFFYVSPDPYHPGRVYATDYGLCKRSDDYGQTWQDDLPQASPIHYGEIVIDPATGQTFLFAGPQMYERKADLWNLNESTLNSYRSLDDMFVLENTLFISGGEFVALDLPSRYVGVWAQGWGFAEFAVDAASIPRRAAFGYKDSSTPGLYVTEDGGRSWTSWAEGYVSPFLEFLYFYTADTLFAVDSWSDPELFEYYEAGRKSLGTLPDIPWQTTYAGDTVLFGGNEGMYLSYNRGKNWTKTLTFPSGSTFYSHRGDPVPGQPVVAYGNSFVYVSMDGGESWWTPDNYPGNMPYSAAIADDTLYFVNRSDWTVYATKDTSDVWISVSDGLPESNLPRHVAANEYWLVIDTQSLMGVPQLFYKPRAPTGVEEGWQALPTGFVLDAPWPNPFNPNTNIRYNIPEAGHVTLQVFDMLGRSVATLKEGVVTAGPHVATFDGSGLASGAYLVRLENEGHTATRRIVLVK